ncbi:MAG: cation:proton antiporter [Candidatus Thermoplasmatota archaeon]|nr:cation:proton antiporter [Candidatus Thermoplasmatota archaeon]
MDKNRLAPPSFMSAIPPSWFQSILGALILALLVAIAIRWVKLPYTIALVIVGLVVGWLGEYWMPEDIELTGLLTAETIFFILLPPLLFEGASAMHIKKLKQNWRPITLLAIPGVLMNTVVIGFICWKLVWADSEHGFLYGLLVGSILAATDPVSVLALVKTLGAPKRLSVLIEGESLFNDGTAVVLFNILLATTLAVVSGVDVALMSIFTAGLSEFLVVVFVGAIAGLLCGLFANWLLLQSDDHLVEIAITLALAFGAFLLAEIMHGSGVISVVVAGLLVGNHGVKEGMTPTARIGMHHFWEVLAFLVNSVLFLLIGYELQAVFSWDSHVLYLSAVGIGAALLARLAVFPLTTIANIKNPNPVSTRWQVALWWGGLRGSIPLALLLLISHVVAHPPEFSYMGETISGTETMASTLAPIYDDMLIIAFSVVLFSLVVQGLTIRPMLQRLGISGSPADAELRYEVALAEVIGSRAALRRLSALNTQGLISDGDQTTLAEPYRTRVKESEAKIRELSEANVVHSARVERARRDLLSAQIQALHDAERTGAISSSVANDVLVRLDKALSESEFKQEEIQDASRKSDSLENAVEDDVAGTLIPESTESIVGVTVQEIEEE